jgi:hypothetical protein
VQVYAPTIYPFVLAQDPSSPAHLVSCLVRSGLVWRADQVLTLWIKDWQAQLNFSLSLARALAAAAVALRSATRLVSFLILCLFFFFSFENSRFSLLPAEVTSPLSSQLSSGHVCFFPRPSAFMSRLLWSSFRATGYDFLHAPEHLLWWNSTVQVQFGTVQYNSPAGKGDGGGGGGQCVLIPSN